MLECMLDRFIAGVFASSLLVACAHTSGVQTDFVSTIPVVRIDVKDGKKPSKREREAVLALDGQSYEARIKVRGSSSSLYPKKQFGLKLHKDDSELKAPLLGMARASSWVLGGPYADKTLIKNVLGLAQARELFPYAPGTRWVELILNGDYHGVYALTEKIERGKDKVDVPSVEDGGFILNVDAGDTPYVQSERGTKYTLVYPKKIDDPASGAAMHSLLQWLSAFEDSLSTEHYATYVHVESFIDYFLQQELWKNVDGFRKSMYMYKGADEKLHMGPSWDFDLGAAGLYFYGGTNPEGWVHARLNYVFIHDRVTWFNELLRHPEYREKVIARWKALREPGALFSDERIRSMIDENVEILSHGPASRNFARWDVIGRPLFPVFFFTVLPLYDTWEEEVGRSEKFLLDRAAWIDAHIDHVGEFAEGKLTY
jgi:CotH protein